MHNTTRQLAHNQKAYRQCIRLSTNQNSVRVAINQNLNNVVAVYLDEYAVSVPNGGAIIPDLWRVDFVGKLFSSTSSNAGGTGYPLIIDNATYTHVVYDQPRLMSEQPHDSLNFLQLRISDETNADVTFTSMTLFLTFVCESPDWRPDQVMANDYLAPTSFFVNDGKVPGNTGPPVNELLQILRN